MDDQGHNSRLHEIDVYISQVQNRVLSLPKFDPLRAFLIQDLAEARESRHGMTLQQDDLERSILAYTEAILLPLPRQLPPATKNIVQLFYSLSYCIGRRAERSNQPEDVKSCIVYLRYLRGQWRQVPNDLPLTVTGSLVAALGVQLRLGLGNVHRDIEEMVDLCDELLDSDIWEDSSATAIDILVAASANIKESPDRQLVFEGVTSYLRKSIMRLPDLHILSTALATLLLSSFERSPSEEEYKEGMAIVDKIISFRGPGNSPSPCREKAWDLATKFARIQFFTHGKPDDLEHAIYRVRTQLNGSSLEDPNRAELFRLLSCLQGFRFNDDGFKRGFEDEQSRTSESAKIPSFRDLTASLPDLNPSNPISVTVTKHRVALRFAGDTTDPADMKDGVKYCRQLLALYPNSELAPQARATLATFLKCVFDYTSDIQYLNEAILAAQDTLNTSELSLFRGVALMQLISFLETRVLALRRRSDANELMQLYAEAVNLEQVRFSRRVNFLCRWALIAHFLVHPSASTAYESVLSSIQASLTFAPTIDIQHSRFATMEDDVKTVPLEYASYQIQTGQLNQAIETLERGRALLWSEMRGFRTSINQIASANPHLAEEFSIVSRELESLTVTSLSNNRAHDGDNVFHGMDPYGDLVMRRQTILGRREELISQIRALPGFETFLEPPSFDTLRSAACHGPVVIVNHSVWRSDILILLHNSPPSLISTSENFYTRAVQLQGQLLGARKNGLESDKFEDALHSVLKGLYELVGQPVIERLNELNVPKQSRVWWCPTSVFCSLPLHAMGPIPSDADIPQYFMDLYIPSYIPSISALNESRKPGSQLIGKPSILLVAHPDESMPNASKEMKAVQATNTKVTTLFSSKATPKAVLKRLRNHPFAHIVSHGILEPGKPFDASFKLHGERGLLLLDIVQSLLPNAEFAFLSACHTAELTDESIADEMIHLSAAMQFCGFRSVVGTMWAMADTDGPDLARCFYDSVFLEETPGIPYYERTAKALRDAVVKLRRKGGISLERWVNFVHYGA